MKHTARDNPRGIEIGPSFFCCCVQHLKKGLPMVVRPYLLATFYMSVIMFLILLLS
jgi:hypothetical protein